MSDGVDDQKPVDTSGINFLAAWRCAYSPEYPCLALATFAFGRTPDEARAAQAAIDAVEDAAAPTIRLVIDRVQAEALAVEFATLAERLRADEDAAEATTTLN